MNTFQKIIPGSQNMDESNLEVILEALAEPVFLLDTSRRVLRINSAGKALFGNMRGMDFSRAVRNPDALACIDRVLTANEARGDDQNSDTVGSTKEQTVISLLVPLRTTFRMTVIALEANSTLDAAAVISLNDISHVLEAKQMRSDFVANVSHELRSPLTSLNGFIETLQHAARDDPEAQQRFLAIMEREAGRMNRIIGDLLSLSKVEENERVRPTQSIDIVALVQRVIAALQPRANADNKTIRWSANGEQTHIPGDDDQLTQVLQNLIENAVKYSKPGTAVEVDISFGEEVPGFNRPVCSISVSDQGEGIEAEHLPRLTERFYRVDKGRSRQMGGTGLGLAIVKHIISRHRGRMNVESVVGEGSTFTVLLPQRI